MHLVGSMILRVLITSMFLVVFREKARLSIMMPVTTILLLKHRNGSSDRKIILRDLSY